MLTVIAKMPVTATVPTDSVNIFVYSISPERGGLRVAWDDNGTWRKVGSGDGIELVKSDFGAWGTHKKMYEPCLYRTPQGWRCLWWVTDSHFTVASADSPDLISWKPQKYVTAANSLELIDSSMIGASPAIVVVGGTEYKGGIARVSRPELLELLAHGMRTEAADIRNSERVTADTLCPSYSLPVFMRATRNSLPTVCVSPHLFGIFFEDINYAADGGLYAELVMNRDFEFLNGEGRELGWGPTYPWTLTDAKGTRHQPVIATSEPVHPNNPHYISIPASPSWIALDNAGFGGITLRKDADYKLSVFARTSDGAPAVLRAELLKDGRKLAAADVCIQGGVGWQKATAELRAETSVSGAKLRIVIPKGTACDLDMISLFPSDTWKGRENGLRADMMAALDSIHPRFVRFPGGCVAHGNGIDNIYDWKGSIGPLETRRPLRNLWGYHQTRGLGYYEYFLMCEDLGAEPLPVLAAGVPCQNSSWPSHCSIDELTSAGQQGGVPIENMKEYIQNVLDLIEYANGSVDSEWGARRAESGHPAPFNLKYIGIGNEDLISDVFEERFRMIYNAVAKAYPEITVIGTVGPFHSGADYDEGWRFARSLNVPMVDEHYYVSPGWLINNRNFYDGYPRGETNIYLGEYASHIPDRKSNIETALSIALYLTDVERNSDVVRMTSYAPLFAKKGHTQWNPDLIYFDNDGVFPTTDYYVQKLFGSNQGDEYLPVELSFDTLNPAAARRIGYSLMRDSTSGDIILKIVNLLPANVLVEQEYKGNALCTTLTGSPDADCVIPYSEVVAVNGTIDVPPYSLSVFRFHGAAK